MAKRGPRVRPARQKAGGARRKATAPRRAGAGRGIAGAASRTGRGRGRVLRRPPAADAPERHDLSPTAVAAEALRTGVIPREALARPAGRPPAGEDQRLLVGDPDDDSLQNEYVGEDTPGGSTPTPDQSDVDEIGLAYGVKEEDSGELRMSAEVLDRRDRRRRGFSLSRRRA
jgi:hypothetical protein